MLHKSSSGSIRALDDLPIAWIPWGTPKEGVSGQLIAHFYNCGSADYP
jgi:hypothetical protein